MREDFHQEDGHSSDLDQKRSGILLTNTNHMENGTESQSWWWANSVKADAQSSEPRVHCPEECSKARVVENCQYTFVPVVKRLKLFFAQLFLLISSIFTEQSQICVKNVKPAMLEQGNLFWWDKLTHCLCRQVRWWKHLHPRPMIPRKKNHCKSTKNEWKSYHNMYWCRIPDNGFCRTVLHDKRHWRIFTIYRDSGLSWVHFARRWKIIWPEKFWFEGTPIFGPYWKSQPVTCKVNMEWKIELHL